MRSIDATGTCLCGAVSLRTTALGTDSGACHCDLCRRWSGGPLFALSCGDDLRFEGEDRITTFDSTECAERGFCSSCGTHLFIRVKENGHYILPAGLFSAEDRLRFDHQTFVDRKPDYYLFADETTNLAGEEIFAQHAAQSE